MITTDRRAFTYDPPKETRGENSPWNSSQQILQDEDPEKESAATKSLKEQISQLDAERKGLVKEGNSANMSEGLTSIWHSGRQDIWSNYSDLTRAGHRNCGLVREFPLFKGNLGWWNIMLFHLARNMLVFFLRLHATFAVIFLGA